MLPHHSPTPSHQTFLNALINSSNTAAFAAFATSVQTCSGLHGKDVLSLVAYTYLHCGGYRTSGVTDADWVGMLAISHF